MEAMRNSWTDDRLDDFRGETQRRFDEVDRRFDEVDRRFDRVDRRFDKIESDIGHLRDEMNTRFDSLQRMMLQFSGTLVIALIGLVVTQV